MIFIDRKTTKTLKISKENYNKSAFIVIIAQYAWYHYVIAVAWFLFVFWLSFRSPIFWGLGKKKGYDFTEQSAFGTLL